MVNIGELAGLLFKACYLLCWLASAVNPAMAVLLTRLSLLQEFGRHAVGLLQGASREYPEPPGGSSRAGRIPTRDLPASPAAVQSFEQAFRAFGGAQSFEELESLGETSLIEMMLLGTTVQLSARTLPIHSVMGSPSYA